MESTRKSDEDNERIKRAYLRYLRNAKGLSETTIDKAASAILRLENAIAFKSFSSLNEDDAEAFREDLTYSLTGKTGKPMTAVSRVNIQVTVRAFIQWLADQPRNKTKITHSFAKYFSPNRKEKNHRELGPPQGRCHARADVACFSTHADQIDV